MTNQWSFAFRCWILSGLGILLALLLWFSNELIAPLVIGALLAFVLNPAIGILTQRLRLSRSLAITIVLFTALASIITLSALMVPRLIAEIQILFTDLQIFLSQVQERLSQPVIILEWELNFEYLLPDLTRLFSESITAIPENAFYLLEATSKNLIWGLVILATTYYLLRDWDRLRDWLLKLAPKPYQKNICRIYQEIKQIWNGYLRGNLALMFITGVMFTLAWIAIGLPGALILGIITGVLTIIPDLGPAIAAALAVLVALFEGSTFLQISNFWFALLVVGIYMVLINIKGIWIRPRIFARSVHMHDGVVFIAIMAAIVLQGILGALIIVPVLASVGVLGRYIYRRFRGLPPWPQDEVKDISDEDVDHAL
jgi:predicted PurR-regulated permease PerM